MVSCNLLEFLKAIHKVVILFMNTMYVFKDENIWESYTAWESEKVG